MKFEMPPMPAANGDREAKKPPVREKAPVVAEEDKVSAAMAELEAAIEKANAAKAGANEEIKRAPESRAREGFAAGERAKFVFEALDKYKDNPAFEGFFGHMHAHPEDYKAFVGNIENAWRARKSEPEKWFVKREVSAHPELGKVTTLKEMNEREIEESFVALVRSMVESRYKNGKWTPETVEMPGKKSAKNADGAEQSRGPSMAEIKDRALRAMGLKK